MKALLHIGTLICAVGAGVVAAAAQTGASQTPQAGKPPSKGITQMGPSSSAPAPSAATRPAKDAAEQPGENSRSTRNAGTDRGPSSNSAGVAPRLRRLSSAVDVPSHGYAYHPRPGHAWSEPRPRPHYAGAYAYAGPYRGGFTHAPRRGYDLAYRAGVRRGLAMAGSYGDERPAYRAPRYGYGYGRPRVSYAYATTPVAYDLPYTTGVFATASMVGLHTYNYAYTTRVRPIAAYAGATGSYAGGYPIYSRPLAPAVPSCACE